MLDIGWSELLVVGVVALLVVGPKELPQLLRTIGRYVGMVRRQANEFRAQFDEALKDSEFEDIKKDFEAIRSDTQRSIREAEQAGRVDPDTEVAAKAQHKPNFDNEDLDWFDDDAEPLPAERAAAAARAASAVTATPAGTVNAEGIKANGAHHPAETGDAKQKPAGAEAEV